MQMLFGLLLILPANGWCAGASYRSRVTAHPAFQRPVRPATIAAFQKFSKFLSGRSAQHGLAHLFKLDPTRRDELAALTPFLSSLTQHDEHAMAVAPQLYPAASEKLLRELANQMRKSGHEATQALSAIGPDLFNNVDPSNALKVRQEAIELAEVRGLALALSAYGAMPAMVRKKVVGKEQDMRRYSAALRVKEDAQAMEEGRTVLITGASSGIGMASAREFASKGYRVALMARRADKISELGIELKQKVDVLELPGDVTSDESARSAVESVIKAWGRLDVLVNSAGVMELGPFIRQPMSVHEKTMGANYFGTVNMLRHALPFMTERGAGHVVNVASIGGVVGVPMMASYNASKFAVTGLTEALRREYYGTGVTFTTFAPGLTDTPMGRSGFRDPSQLKKKSHKTPEQVASKIVDAAERKLVEVFYGETSGFVAKLTRFFPRAIDWITSYTLRRFKSDLAG